MRPTAAPQRAAPYRSVEPVTRITVRASRPRYSCEHKMRGDGPSLAKRETQMTERSNRDRRELDERELESVCGGFFNDGGCIGPWIVDGKITTHQPAGPNPWLPGGIFHR